MSVNHRVKSSGENGGKKGKTLQKLELQQVYKTFGDLNVLEDVNLSVKKGEFVAIVGPSGCGKSTALRMFAGLEFPDRGQVLADGKPITGPDPSRTLIFQEHALYPWRTVEQNVIFGLELAGMKKTETKERVERVLKLVGLQDFASYYPSQLSGGMKQRAAIARALVMDPEVLLLDEPYGALDAITRMTMQNELIDLWQGSGKSMLLITHDMDEAIYLADRIYVFSRRPGTVVREIINDMPRPRLRNDARFLELRAEMMEHLQI